MRNLGESMEGHRLLHYLGIGSALDGAADPTLGLLICDYRFSSSSRVSFFESLRKWGIESPVLFISATPDNGALLKVANFKRTLFFPSAIYDFTIPFTVY